MHPGKGNNNNSNGGSYHLHHNHPKAPIHVPKLELGQAAEFKQQVVSDPEMEQRLLLSHHQRQQQQQQQHSPSSASSSSLSPSSSASRKKPKQQTVATSTSSSNKTMLRPTAPSNNTNAPSKTSEQLRQEVPSSRVARQIVRNINSRGKPGNTLTLVDENNNNNKEEKGDDDHDDGDKKRRQGNSASASARARPTAQPHSLYSLDRMAICWNNGFQLPSDMNRATSSSSTSRPNTKQQSHKNDNTSHTNNNNNVSSNRSGLTSAATTTAAHNNNNRGGRSASARSMTSQFSSATSTNFNNNINNNNNTSTKDPALVTALQSYINRELSMRDGEGPESVLEVHREVLRVIGDTFKSYGGLITNAVDAFDDALLHARSFKDIASELKNQHSYEVRRLEEKIEKLECDLQEANSQKIVAQEEARQLEETFEQNQKEMDEARSKLTEDLEVVTDERDMDLSRMLTLIRAVKDADMRLVTLQQQNNRFKAESERSTSLRYDLKQVTAKLDEMKELYKETMPKKTFEAARIDFEKRIKHLEEENQHLRRVASFRAADCDRMARLVRQYYHQRSVALAVQQFQEKEEVLGLEEQQEEEEQATTPNNNKHFDDAELVDSDNDEHDGTSMMSTMGATAEQKQPERNRDDPLIDNVTGEKLRVLSKKEAARTLAVLPLTPRPDWKGSLKKELEQVAPDAETIGVVTTKGWVGHLITRLKMFQKVVRDFDIPLSDGDYYNHQHDGAISNSMSSHHHHQLQRRESSLPTYSTQQSASVQFLKQPGGGASLSSASPPSAGMSLGGGNNRQQQLQLPQHHPNTSESRRSSFFGDPSSSKSTAAAGSPPTPSALSMATASNQPPPRRTAGQQQQHTTTPHYQRIIPPQKRGIYLLPNPKLQAFGTSASASASESSQQQQNNNNNNALSSRPNTAISLLEGNTDTNNITDPQQQQQQQAAATNVQGALVGYSTNTNYFSFLPPYIRSLGCVRVDDSSSSTSVVTINTSNLAPGAPPSSQQQSPSSPSSSIHISRKEGLEHLFSFWEYRFNQIACPKKTGEQVPRHPLSSLLRSFARFTIDRVVAKNNNINNNNINNNEQQHHHSTSHHHNHHHHSTSHHHHHTTATSSIDGGYSVLTQAAEYSANFLAFIDKHKDTDVRCHVFAQTMSGVLPERLVLDMMQHIETIREEARKVMSGVSAGNQMTMMLGGGGGEGGSSKQPTITFETSHFSAGTTPPPSAPAGTSSATGTGTGTGAAGAGGGGGTSRRVRKAVLMECLGPLLAHKSIPFLDALKFALGRDTTLDVEELLWPSSSITGSFFLELLVGQALDENLELYYNIIESITSCATVIDSPINEQPYLTVDDLNSCITAAEPNTPEIVLQDLRRLPVKRAKNRIAAIQQQQQQQALIGAAAIARSSMTSINNMNMSGGAGASSSSLPLSGVASADVSTTNNPAAMIQLQLQQEADPGEQKLFLDDVLHEVAWAPLIRRPPPLGLDQSQSMMME